MSSTVSVSIGPVMVRKPRSDTGQLKATLASRSCGSEIRGTRQVSVSEENHLNSKSGPGGLGLAARAQERVNPTAMVTLDGNRPQ